MGNLLLKEKTFLKNKENLLKKNYFVMNEKIEFYPLVITSVASLLP